MRAHGVLTECVDSLEILLRSWGGLFVEEVEKVRFGAEFFFEYEDAFVGEHGTDLGGGVEQVAEDACPGGARFEAGGELAFAGAM